MGRQDEPHTHNNYRKEKENHELIFSWLSWLAVLLIGVYTQLGTAMTTDSHKVVAETCSLGL